MDSYSVPRDPGSFVHGNGKLKEQGGNDGRKGKEGREEDVIEEQERNELVFLITHHVFTT